MDEKRLAEIRARCEAATAGPWVVETSYSDENVQAIRGGRDMREVVVDTDDCSFPPMRADAAFIAHARQDIPDLLAEVAAIKEELATKARWAEQVERQFFMARAEAERLKEWFSYAEETIHREFCSGEHPEGFCTRARP